MSASLVNSANLGFPIAAYVLGDISLAAPVVMFQLALYTPLYVGLLDQLTAGRGARARVRPRPRTEALRRFVQTLGNPMIVGSALGLLFSWQNWRLPEQIHESVELLAGASIPLMLLAFGLSLVGSHPLDKASGRRRDVLLATGIKLLLHPLLAYVIAAFVFGMDGLMLLAAVVMASLPTAQNVLVAAVRYGTGETIARDTVLVTTILGIPSMAVVALLFA
jgi:malonate transporter and related proteins